MFLRRCREKMIRIKKKLKLKAESNHWRKNYNSLKKRWVYIKHLEQTRINLKFRTIINNIHLYLDRLTH